MLEIYGYTCISSAPISYKGSTGRRTYILTVSTGNILFKAPSARVSRASHFHLTLHVCMISMTEVVVNCVPYTSSPSLAIVAGLAILWRRGLSLETFDAIVES